jgi:predicted phage terminase large subunit-like protein
VLMHLMEDKTYVISHIARGQWSALQREEQIKSLVMQDKKSYPMNYQVIIEQEPGSGGKESVEASIRNLAGVAAFADKVTGSKEVRAEPFVAQVQGGNVWLVSGPWCTDFWAECSKFMDQVDAAAAAFNRLIKGYGYDRTYSGFM